MYKGLYSWYKVADSHYNFFVFSYVVSMLFRLEITVVLFAINPYYFLYLTVKIKAKKQLIFKHVAIIFFYFYIV